MLAGSYHDLAQIIEKLDCCIAFVEVCGAVITPESLPSDLWFSSCPNVWINEIQIFYATMGLQI